MFAFLALAGDLGAAMGPGMVGGIAEAVGGDLKTGLLFATVFPTVLIFGWILLMKKQKVQVLQSQQVWLFTVLLQVML